MLIAKSRKEVIMEKKYVAYVGSYNSTGNALGITIYDIDMKHFGFEKIG